jgi:hypothetical protein
MPRAVNTLRLGYKDQHVNAVYGNDTYKVCENRAKRINTLQENAFF